MFKKAKKIDFEGIAITAGIIGFLTIFGAWSFQMQVAKAEGDSQSSSNQSTNW